MNDEPKKKYWYGFWNKLSRYYFYITRGADVYSSFKYIATYVVGIYLLLKFTDPRMIIVMGVIVLPILLVTGYYHVHRVGKVVDFLNVQYSSHWGRYTFELMEKQIILLEEINKKLEEKKCDC